MNLLEESKAYVWGTDAKPFSNENYEVTSTKLLSQKGKEIVVTGTIEKSVEDEKYLYHYKATLMENSDYTYLPYCIKSFNYEIETNKNDNIFHLIDKIEETDGKEKK